MRPYILIKNTARYSDIDPKLPDFLVCYGTKEQAEEIAERLSNWNAGCDYAWYVEGDPEGGG